MASDNNGEPKARHAGSANLWKPNPNDPEREAKQAQLDELERQFAERAKKVPTNKMLFDDPVIKRIMRKQEKLWNIVPPPIRLSRVRFNREGYTTTGRYVGVGAPLFCAVNSRNQEEVELRATDVTMARSIVKRMWTDPNDAAVRQRFTPGQIKKFVTP